jgi:hypothetical protein
MQASDHSATSYFATLPELTKFRIDGFFRQTVVTAAHTTRFVRLFEVIDRKSEKVRELMVYGVEGERVKGARTSSDYVWVTIPKREFASLIKVLLKYRDDLKRVSVDLGIDADGRVTIFVFDPAQRESPTQSSYPGALEGVTAAKVRD